MRQINQVVVLKKDLTLSKEGLDDIHYEQGTLLNVEMDSNDHTVAQHEKNQTLILNLEDQGKLLEYI